MTKCYVYSMYVRLAGFADYTDKRARMCMFPCVCVVYICAFYACVPNFTFFAFIQPFGSKMCYSDENIY